VVRELLEGEQRDFSAAGVATAGAASTRPAPDMAMSEVGWAPPRTSSMWRCRRSGERPKKERETRPMSTITWHSPVRHHPAQDRRAGTASVDCGSSNQGLGSARAERSASSLRCGPGRNQANQYGHRAEAIPTVQPR